MSWGYSHYPEYVSVAEKKKKAEALVKKMIKKGQKINPIIISGKKIANSFWGEAWCKHLESFKDYDNRLGRGRSYVRSSAVVDLKISTSQVKAMVNGSNLYKVEIKIKSLDPKKWKNILNKSSGEIGSIIELLQGKISSSIIKIITDSKNGLFPLNKEISFDCSCPDYANMCKHIAATLYGIGARLDDEPELLFVLRGVDYNELISNIKSKSLTKKSTKSKTIKDQDLSALFGIDIQEDKKLVKKAVLKKKKSDPLTLPESKKKIRK